MTRVAVLAGGRSPEREVSLRSGHRIATALAERGHDAKVVDPGEVQLAETLADGGFAACYLALHGKEGEDGTVQRLLELLGLPYTGTGPLACEIAFDKILAKETLDAAGIPNPPWAAVEAAALRDLGGGAVLTSVVQRVGLPAVVKPSRAGSAMGLSFVDREGDLPSAVMAALSFSDAAIVEHRIDGVEVSAGLVGSAPEVLPLVEIVPKSGVYDYASRYTAGATEYFTPARLEDEAAAACRAQAATAFGTLGLRDVGRADLIVDRDGFPWLLEVNVSPGMTETSLLPMGARAGGLSEPDLCERVLALALQRR